MPVHASRVARNDPRYGSRRRRRHARRRYQTRYSSLPDGLCGRKGRVLHDLLAPRHAQPPIRAHVVRVFCQTKLLFCFCLALSNGAGTSTCEKTYLCSCVASLEAQGHLRARYPDSKISR
jgi:hypothetical protein